MDRWNIETVYGIVPRRFFQTCWSTFEKKMETQRKKRAERIHRNNRRMEWKFQRGLTSGKAFNYRKLFKHRKENCQKELAQKIVKLWPKENNPRKRFVVCTGGEPLLQAEFTHDLLAACRDVGISTAIETAANVAWERIAALLPVVDLVMMDIKHLDSDVHRRATGVPVSSAAGPTWRAAAVRPSHAGATWRRRSGVIRPAGSRCRAATRSASPGWRRAIHF
jgi:pyruvate-formate lyase-activating enzyme